MKSKKRITDIVNFIPYGHDNAVSREYLMAATGLTDRWVRKHMKPILFSTPMVQAILNGRKTMTRRVIKQDGWQQWIAAEADNAPYRAGDILWVRETWCNYNNKFYYKADKKCYGCTEDGICMPRGIESHITCELCESVGVDGYIRWRPSIHMPREAARIFLRVKTVRVERLQDITEEDAIAEGMRIGIGGAPYFSCRDAFAELWDKLNAKSGYGWDANPWVWVISFERCEKPDDIYSYGERRAQ